MCFNMFLASIALVSGAVLSNTHEPRLTLTVFGEGEPCNAPYMVSGF